MSELRTDSVTLPVDDDQEVEALRQARRAGVPRNWRPADHPASAQPLDMDAVRAGEVGEMPRFRLVNTVEEGPDPSDIKIIRDRHKKTIPNWLFYAVIVIIGLGGPALIFITMMQGR